MQRRTNSRQGERCSGEHDAVTPESTSGARMRSLPPFRPRGHTSRQKSRGQSLVEFALVLPVFLVFLAAALDLGRVFYATVSLNNAAREGVFEASKHPDAFGAGQSCDASDAGRIVCRVQFE